MIRNITTVFAFIIGIGSVSLAQSDGCAGVPSLAVGTGSCSPTAYTLPGSYTNGALVLASCFSAGNDRDDGWYSVTAPSTGTMTIELNGDQGHTLAVFSACGGGTELACDQQNSGVAAVVSFSATSGVTYYVQVHRNQGNNTADMTGDICAYMGAPSSGPHNIGDGDLTTCSADLFDTGGSGGDYSSSENIVETYCSATPGQCVSITFNSFSTESCCDDLTIYDGPTTSDPVIGVYAGSTNPGTITSSSGCLTFEWSSDGSVVNPGWDATLTCVACPTCSDGIQNGTETGVDCGGASCAPCPCGVGPVPNDEPCCATVAPVNPDQSCALITAGTVANATASPINTSACFGTENDDVWYEFVATSSTHYIDLLNVSGSTTDLYHSVWEGACGAPTLVAGSCSDPNSSTVTGLTPGNTYYIRINSYYSSAETTTFDVCIGSPPPPPSNDDCPDAISVTVNPDAICNSVTAGYTVGATSSMAGCTGTANDDVWFSFVALDANQQIDILNATGTTDLVHELFSGSCGSLTSLGCSDPNTSNYTNLVPGQTYFVRVYTYSSTGSNTGFDICITSPCGISGTAPNCGLNYTYSTTAYNPANYNTGSALTFSDDRFADSYTSIGFDFCFDGVTYSECLVSSNGYIIFPGCYSAAPTATTVTPGGSSAWDIEMDAPNTTDAPRNAILGPWQDIDPSVSGVIRTSTEGTAPNRVFIVKFDDVAMFSSSCNTDVFAGQIMLYETSNNIEIHIGEKTSCPTWNEEGAIMGITAYDGTTAIIPSGYNYSTPWTVPTNSPEGHSFTNNCNCNVILPVELVEFTAYKDGNVNVLQWGTASELNNDYFVVEHSTNGYEYYPLETIDGMGTTQQATEYRTFHADPATLEYYRLRQVDMDGSVSYSKSISVHRQKVEVSIYPNPSEGTLYMSCEGMNGLVTVRYVDVVGKSFEEKVKVDPATGHVTLETFEKLGSGMYLVHVYDEQGNELHQENIVKR